MTSHRETDYGEDFLYTKHFRKDSVLRTASHPYLLAIPNPWRLVEVNSSTHMLSSYDTSGKYGPLCGAGYMQAGRGLLGVILWIGYKPTVLEGDEDYISEWDLAIQ